jgi:uncharacterized membrane protein
MEPHRRTVFTTVRIAVASLLILTLSGASLPLKSKRTTTIFALDLSASMNGDGAIEFLNEALKNRPEGEDVGVIVFGENCLAVDVPLSEGVFVKKGFTNIAEGLRLANALIPDGAKKRVVLVSDGAENAGDARAQARILAERGVTINTAYLSGAKIEAEVQLTGIKIPEFLRKDSEYDIDVSIDALNDGTSRIYIYKNGELIINDNISHHKGENKYIFSDKVGGGGGVNYRAEILPENDVFSENNRIYAYSREEGAPKALLIENGGGEFLLDMLENAGVSVSAVKPSTAPTSLENLNLYDAVILADVSIDELPDGFAEIAESYVKNAGGGLIMTGGENSFALGGWTDTPIEAALPVNARLEEKEETPTLGMVIVLDRSGSMSSGRYGVSKLELAKEAAIRAFETLSEEDSFGLVAFDDGYDWASPLQTVGGSGAADDIARITPGGGTSILPGLSEAYRALADADVKQKHIVLLTDGQAERSGYAELVVGTSGITLSTVAVGSDSDTGLLSGLAEMGGGRYYYSDEFTDLPKIFAKETNIAGKRFLNNDLFYPSVGDGGQITETILNGAEAMPPLAGYVATTRKDRADVVLTAPNGEPVLAAWQYGLGKSVAWTSDMAGVWSAEWLGSREGTRVLTNALSWLTRNQPNVRLNTELIGDTVELTMTVPYSDGVSSARGVVVAPDGDTANAAFKQTAPGEFKAIIPSGGDGAYTASVELETPGGARVASAGTSVSYSKEYDVRTVGGENLLKRLAAVGGGQFITSPGEAFLGNTAEAGERRDVSGALLTAALILFLLDIALRRFPDIMRVLETIPKQAGRIAALSQKQRKRKTKRALKPQEQTNDGASRQTARQSTSGALVSRKKKRSGR